MHGNENEAVQYGNHTLKSTGRLYAVDPTYFLMGDFHIRLLHFNLHAIR